MKNMKKLGIMLLAAIAITSYACVRSSYPSCGYRTLTGIDAFGLPCSCGANSTATYDSVTGGQTGRFGYTVLADFTCTWQCTAQTSHGAHDLSSTENETQAQPDVNSGYCDEGG